MTARKHNTRARLPDLDRRRIFQLWLDGKTYAEIARSYRTYRQKPRDIVLSFRPSFQDYRTHDHFRRLGQVKRRPGRRPR